MKKLLAVFILLTSLFLAVSAFAEDAQVTAQLAADGQSEEGFVAILTADGTVYSQLAVDSFTALIRDFNIDWYIFSDGEDSTIKTVKKAVEKVFSLDISNLCD